MTAHYLLY